MKRWLVGPLALALALGTVGHAGQAAPAKKEPKPTKPKPKPGAKETARLEAMLGKTLTDDQKNQVSEATVTHNAAIKAANDAFDEALAKVSGMTLAEYKAKEKEWMIAQRKAKQATTTQASTTTTTTEPAKQ